MSNKHFAVLFPNNFNLSGKVALVVLHGSGQMVSEIVILELLKKWKGEFHPSERQDINQSADALESFGKWLEYQPYGYDVYFNTIDPLVTVPIYELEVAV